MYKYISIILILGLFILIAVSIYDGFAYHSWTSLLIYLSVLTGYILLLYSLKKKGILTKSLSGIFRKNK